MPKQIRTALIDFPNEAAEQDRAMKRNIAQAFFGHGRPEASNGAPSDEASSTQVVDDAPLATRTTAMVRRDAADNGAESTLPDIAHESEDTPPWDADEHFEEAIESDDDHEWQTHSDVCWTSDGYLPGESPFDPPNSYPSGFGRKAPPRITDQQKVAIDMILCGKKLKVIAEKLGIHPGTLWRWRRHDLDFRRSLTLASQRGLMHSIEQLRQLVPKAVDIVHSHIDDENFQAAIHVLRLVHRHLETYEHIAS